MLTKITFYCGNSCGGDTVSLRWGKLNHPFCKKARKTWFLAFFAIHRFAAGDGTVIDENRVKCSWYSCGFLWNCEYFHAKNWCNCHYFVCNLRWLCLCGCAGLCWCVLGVVCVFSVVWVRVWVWVWVHACYTTTNTCMKNCGFPSIGWEFGRMHVSRQRIFAWNLVVFHQLVENPDECMFVDSEELYEILWFSINWVRIRKNACYSATEICMVYFSVAMLFFKNLLNLHMWFYNGSLKSTLRGWF